MVEFILIFFIASIFIIAILSYFIFTFRQKIQELTSRLSKKETKSYQMGENQYKGNINELLAGFALLTEYKQLALLSSVSKQFSIDLLGINDDSVDFIEVKTKGSPLSTEEKKVQRLINDKKVCYRIIDGDFPEFQINERPQKNNKKKFKKLKPNNLI